MTDTEKTLYEYSDTKRRIRELELQLDELEAKKAGVYDKLLGVKPPKDVRVSGGLSYDPVVDAVAQLVDVYAKRIRNVAGQLGEAHGKLAWIEELVRAAGLSEIEQRYVRLRYFDGLPVWKVAQELHFCEKQAFNYKRAALGKISDAVHEYTALSLK
jgi:hypothetical protein